MEFFIRDKYEKKKYYDKNAVNDSIVSKKYFLNYVFTEISMSVHASLMKMYFMDDSCVEFL